MGLFDKLGIGSGRSFYTRDFRNAYHLRPDTNPPRQKFQGYVNFILNRELFASLFGSVDNSVFRTQISSLVRKASLPDITFKTETKNSYNRKKIIQTGVDYESVSLTVMDTVGNEWLSLLMNYYSYHFMNVRNKTLRTDRDPVRPASTSTLMQNSVFGGTAGAQTAATGTPNIDQETVYDSNAYGYNTNLDPNFFERIDFILYHGNKGVQYSIINPTLKSLKMGDIDYSSSDILEYELTFDYENFVPYSVTNFTLSDADVQRFEQAYKFVGPAFEEGRKPIAIGTTKSPATSTSLDTLGAPASAGGTGGRSRGRSGQPRVVVPAASSPAAAPDAGPSAPPPIDSDLAGSPEFQAQSADAAARDARAAARQRAAVPGLIQGDERAKLPDVYGESAKFAAALGKTKKFNFLENLVGNAAGAALGAALSGRNVKNAVVGSVIATSVSGVSANIANDRSRPAKDRGATPAPQGETPPARPPGG